MADNECCIDCSREQPCVEHPIGPFGMLMLQCTLASTKERQLQLASLPLHCDMLQHHSLLASLLQADWRCIMTGTPLQNELNELYCLLAFLEEVCPPTLTSRSGKAP